MKLLILHGDSITELRKLPAESIDAVVTDPPYGLSDHSPEDVVDCLRCWLAGEPYYPSGAGGGFMDREWDKWVPGPELWREVFRVMKPGAYLLAAAASRTTHLMSIAIHLAGFEIRDLFAWLNGQGFPKSLDVSKALEKVRHEDKESTRVVCRAIRAALDSRGWKSRDLTAHFNGCHSRLIDHWAARDTDSQPEVIPAEHWPAMLRLLPELASLSEEVARLNERKGTTGEAWNAREVIGTYAEQVHGVVSFGPTSRDGLVRGEATTAEGKQLEGWGTHMKPAIEPFTFARKPFRGTVAANIQKHGTGALNIAGCRDDAGRWPANVGHDGLFDGESWAPYFYSAKATREERELGLEHLAKRIVDPTRTLDSDGRNSPRAGAGRAGAPRANAHPTVKPLALMRWLCRLITPPGGTVLDCFAGSGTTGMGAILEGFGVILIERESEFLPVIRGRNAWALRQVGRGIEADALIRFDILPPPLCPLPPPLPPPLVFQVGGQLYTFPRPLPPPPRQVSA